MGTSYSRSYSPSSMSGVGPARTSAKDIRDRVYALNESVQRQLEEADMTYMELYERHKRDKEQWMQQMQSGSSSSGAQPPPPQPSPHHHMSRDNDDSISDTDYDQYSQFLGFFIFQNYPVIFFLFLLLLIVFILSNSVYILFN